MNYPTNQQPPRKPMGTFGAVFWGVLLANIVTVVLFAMMVSAEGERAVSGHEEIRGLVTQAKAVLASAKTSTPS